jgi:hypothetical protein
VRLLVALDLPEMVRREAESWQQEALTDPALRHNTGLRIVLMFLGHRPQREVGRYLEAIRELCASAPAPLVELGDAVAKGPTPELPRVFALPAKSPEAEVLQIGLRSVFTNQGLYIYEPRERTLAAPDRRQGADRGSQVTPPGGSPQPPGPSDPGGSARSIRGATRWSLSVRNATGRSALLAAGQGRSAGVDLRDSPSGTTMMDGRGRTKRPRSR